MKVPKIFVKVAYKLMLVYWTIFKPITMGTRAILIKDNKIVLVKTKYSEAWNFPGGGPKKKESIEQAIRREVFEECNIKMNNMELLGVFTRLSENKNDHIMVFYSDDFIQEKGESSWEIGDVKYFSLNDLPEGLGEGSRLRLEELKKSEKGLFKFW